MIRVGVIGACGRMGRMVCGAVAEAEDMDLVAAIDRSSAGTAIGEIVGRAELEVPVATEPEALVDAGVEVAVDFTHPEVVRSTVDWCVERGLHLVVGTTGLTAQDLSEIGERIEAAGGRSNVLVAPNFAVGAVLMERFAAMAAHVFPAVEVIELHHDGKADAPSGTSLATARRILGERGEAYRGPDRESLEGARGGDLEGVRVHSVRLPGLVAHQEVIFGGQGQTLTIRHDTTDRSAFMPGVVLAVRAIGSRPGLTVGLEPLLDLPAGP